MTAARPDRTTASKTVLIVEDDQEFRRVLSLAFRWAGFDIVQAGDGLTALALLESSRVDVVVLDLGLPGFDGLVVRDEIAAHSSTSHIPIVVVTGSENPVPGVPPDRVLRKPVAPEPVVVTVAKCLREARSERK